MEKKFDFTFRKITQDDKAAVTALCSKIWDGDDYLPKRFDSWVAEKSGCFTACLHEGKIVGLGKLSFLAPGHAWLEGLRKDPDAQVKGVGTAYSRYALGQLRALDGIKSVRFSTYVRNAESKSLNEKLGFVTIEIHSLKSKKLAAQADNPPQRAALDKSGYAMRKIIDPEESIARMRLQGWFENFICFSWKAYPSTEPALVEKLMAGGIHYEALDSQGRSCGSIWYNDDSAERHIKIVGLQADSAEAAQALLAAAEDACALAGYDYIEALVPPQKKLMEFFAAAGYESWEQENDFCIYELPLYLLNNF